MNEIDRISNNVLDLANKMFAIDVALSLKEQISYHRDTLNKLESALNNLSLTATASYNFRNPFPSIERGHPNGKEWYVERAKRELGV